MSHQPADTEAAEAHLVDQKRQLAQAYRDAPDEPIEDYELVDAETVVTLSELFGEHDDLIVIHNMGRDCPYCTMWADGFNGLLPHIEDRASFVVTSPDPPEVQQAIATERGWAFEMASTATSSFAEDLGFVADGRYLPGISTLYRRDGGTIVRVASRRFGPFDDFCSAWNMFSILHDGVDGWEPRVELRP